MLAPKGCIPDDKPHRQMIERLQKGVYWTEPVPSEHCSAYSQRSYSAVLKSDAPLGTGWLEVCKSMPVAIHGSKSTPDYCQRNVGIVLVDAARI